MRLRVRHATRYRYTTPVDLGSHMLHLSPRCLPHQRVIWDRIAAQPPALSTSESLDHFGNRVTWLSLEQPHAAFDVVAEALVEVQFPAPPDPLATPAWEDVAAQARQGGPEAWEAAEFGFDSPMAPADPDAGAYVAPCLSRRRPILEALLDLNGRIRRDFAFRSGVTTIRTPVSRVMAQRAGVCQDFAHVMIAGLRAHGLPARYVSGYLRTRPPPGGKRRRGVDQSHAWVGCWLGPAHGWVDLDPTNDLVVREEHVVLGWGRDYGDVSPVRGIILGGGKHALSVSVDLDEE
ncbi:MAG: transglutaminase family protein [Acidisphaera sp.]|nr:transglutaminase family protein [Acidisphaera sp.]